LQTTHENETLNKRAYRAEEEVQSLHEKLSKISEENEQKSKVIQQYILRDNVKKLQLEDAQVKPVNSRLSLTH
jgi:hypothetical protein